MNILFLCHRLPFPPNKGEKIRAFNILTHLSKRHTVHLGTFADDPADMRHFGTVREIVAGQCMIVPLTRAAAGARMLSALVNGGPLTTSYFASARLRHWVADTLRTKHIDRVVLFSTAMAPYLLACADFDPQRVILDMVDVDSDKWRQYAGSSAGPLSWIYRREARTLFALERKAAGTFGGTLLVSPFEAQTFADLAPETRERVHSVPNGVDLAQFEPDMEYANPFGVAEVPIVMTGTMDYRPNAEGALWFAERVLPAVRAVLPAARFHVVGGRPAAKLKSLSGEGMAVTGAVEDVRPYLAHAAAVVAPLHLARGVQNKVLEAMAMRKPVVATTPATRALTVKAGVELWIEDDAQRFAAAVIDAAAGAARARIAGNGRRYVEENHDWARNLAGLDRLLEDEPRPRPDIRAQWRGGFSHLAGAADGASGII